MIWEAALRQEIGGRDVMRAQLNHLVEFVKSSYSNNTNDTDCVEVAMNVAGTVALRDSKQTAGPVIRITDTAWAAFAAAQ